MISRYQAYPEYKDSGVEWLGEIPEHWNTIKLGCISSFGRGLPITKANLQDEGIPCVSYGEVHSKFSFQVDPNKHDLKFVSESYLNSSPYSLLLKGDFVFADTSEDIDGSGNFTQLVSNERLFAGYHTVMVRPDNNNHHRFLAYLFDSQEFRSQIRSSVKGIKVFSITQSILKSANTWLPPINEQQKIANFLDHETSKIDTLITKQQKLIELLKEKRQATISQTVTKGLNPNTPMKDSGIEWLDQVPEHWEVTKLRFISSFGRGLGITKANLQDDGIPCVSYGEIHSKYGFEVNAENNPLMCVDEDYLRTSPECCVSEGDVVFADTSEDIEGAGNFTQINGKERIFAGYHTVVVRLNTELHNRFMAYVFESDSFRNQIRTAVKGVKVLSITQSILKNSSVWLPPLDVQKAITEYLDSLTSKIDKLITRQEQSIELIQERKTALISAAVTGKIDLRDWD